MIRLATLADVPAIVQLGMAFADAEYKRFVAATPAAIAQLARTVIDGACSDVCMAAQDGVLVGMIGMTTYENPFSQEVTATEIAWWMTPAARGSRAALKLLRWAEGWARAKGATRFQMIAPNDRVGQFYERLGFERVEIHYQRRLA